MIKLVTSDHNFVLSDQDGVLVRHMSFQVKKLFAALRKGDGSIAHEAKPNGLLIREGSNCFSITKYQQISAVIKLENAS